MKERVLETIKNKNLIHTGETVVVGFSGGADSMCLVSVLNEIKAELGFDMVLVHINHGIRGEEALRDEQFCVSTSKEYGLDIRVFKEDIPSYAKEKGLTEEEAGRKIRYARFSEVCREVKSHKIAVAHNANDQVETTLFNMFRGSSLSGLAGIKYEAPLAGHEDITIIRPLLGTTREGIEEYLKNSNKSWCEDSTNSETLYSRNILRHNIIPEIEKNFSGAENHIREVASDISEAMEYLNTQADALYATRYSDGALDIKGFRELSEYMKKQLVYRYICEVCGRKKDIQRVHVNAVLELANNTVGKCVNMPYGVTISRSYESLVALSKEASRELCEIDVEILDGNAKFSTGINDLWLDGEKLLEVFETEGKMVNSEGMCLSFIRENLEVRHPEQEDYFCPYVDGRKKLLSQLFIEKKIPAAKRSGLTVVAVGHHVLWIVGVRNDETLRVSSETKNIIHIMKRG